MVAIDMKILHLISSSGFFGAENVVLEVATEQKAIGHHVTIGVFNNRYNPNLELIERALDRSIDTHVFDCRGRIDLLTISRIRRFAKENSIDIIHSHGYKSNIYTVLSNMGNSRPIVTTCHNWINSNAKMGIYTQLDKIFIRAFDAVVPVSDTVRKILLDSGLKKGKIKLIENGINTSRFKQKENICELKKSLGIAIDKLVLGTVGRLTKEKGHAYLIRAAKRVIDSGYDCMLLIVGEGNLRYQLEEEAELLGIRDRVVFTGKRADIPAILAIFNIFVLPSLTEGQPIALFEAMAAGRAIVASDVGDVKKILMSGKLGTVVNPEDSDALAKGIIEFLNNPAMIAEIGAMACHEVHGHHSSTRMAQEYIQLYESIIR